MTAEEYKAFCLRCLDTHDWQREGAELADSYRKRYLSGGWNEDDLATLVTLHLLFEYQEFLSGEDLLLAGSIWRDLPVRDELREEVIRKCVIEERLQVLENIESKPDDPYRSIYESSLAKARAGVLAAFLGILPGTPEYDEWVRQHQSADVEGSEAE